MSDVVMSRRRALGFIAAAPAIVRASSLMKLPKPFSYNVTIAYDLAIEHVSPMEVYGRSPAMSLLPVLQEFQRQIRDNMIMSRLQWDRAVAATANAHG